MRDFVKFICLSALLVCINAPAMDREDLAVQLIEAAWRGNAAEARRLVQAGADVTLVRNRLQNENEADPLLVCAVERNNEPAVRLLLILGADVNKPDDRKNTPLHCAAWWGSLPIADCLIKAGANLNAKDYDDRKTPLMVAIKEKHYPIAQLLVRSGAHVCVKDWWGNTALTIAAKLGDPKYAELIIDRLLQLPSDVQLKKAYTFLLCLKKKGCPEELCSMIWRYIPKVIAQENRQFPLDSVACWSIKNIKNPTVKKKLFEQYWPGMVSEAEQEESSWCTIF